MRAATPAVTFDSDEVALLGVLHLPEGEGPHPVAVLLHGFPGNERNFDLAQSLRRAGYAALVFHYRGSWRRGDPTRVELAERSATSSTARSAGRPYACGWGQVVWRKVSRNTLRVLAWSSQVSSGISKVIL